MRNLDAELALGDELAWSPVRLLWPDASVGHLPFIYWLIKVLKPGVTVTLGVGSGNSYFALCQALSVFNPAGRAYGVDRWDDEDDVLSDVTAFNEMHFGLFSHLLRMSRVEARGFFGQGGVDLLHLANMAEYDAVKACFETWLPALSARSLVVVHGTEAKEEAPGVWRYWQELRERYPSFEFNHSGGLGLVAVGSNQETQFQALFSYGQQSTEALRFRQRIAGRGGAFQRHLQDRTLSSASGHPPGQIEALTTRMRAAEAAAADQAVALETSLRREAELKSKAEQQEAQAALATRTVQELEGRLDTLRSEFGRVERACETKIGRVAASYEAELVEAARRLQSTRVESASNLHQVEAIERAYLQSTSWKLTRPLRFVSRLLRGGTAEVGGPQVLARSLHQRSNLAPAVEAGTGVEASIGLKEIMRALLRIRLDAFLGGAARLDLPRASRPEVSIVLVLFNQAELTFACLSSIVETLGALQPKIEVVIVDNASTDATAELLARVHGATIIRNSTNMHFLHAVNQAGRAVSGETMLLLNNDAQLMPDAVGSALRTLRSTTTIGAVGGRIILPDGTLQEAGSIIWSDGTCIGYGRGQHPSDPLFASPRDVDFCSGAFLLTWTSLWRQLGGFDETFAPAYYEEVDYCVRLRIAGFRIVYDPGTYIIHYEFGSSAGSAEPLALQASNYRKFVSKHADWLAMQPARTEVVGLPPSVPAVVARMPEVPSSRPAAADPAVAIPFDFPQLLLPTPRIAVMCHSYYEEVLPEIVQYLGNLPVPADLFFSTDTSVKRQTLEATLRDWQGGRVEVRVFPNRGRDIAPKLVGFADIYPSYDLVLHIHTKKSDHSDFLAAWRPFLYENLLGSQRSIMSILDAFARQPQLGMVAPLHFEAVRRWIGWHGNYELAKSLADRMGIDLSPGRAIDFPSGSMFWARPSALQPLLDLHLSFADFPEEVGAMDHTLAHAIERLFFYVCERSGHSWLKIAAPKLFSSSARIQHLESPAALEWFIVEHGMVLTGSVPIEIAPEPAPLFDKMPEQVTRPLSSDLRDVA